MGVADRTLKTFDYISKGLLPSDDARIREESGRTNTGLLFREEKATRGRQPDGFEGTGDSGLGDFEQETLDVEPLIAVLGHYARIIDRILYLFTRLP